MHVTRSTRPSCWVWSLLSVHLIFLACEMVSLAVRGHFHVASRGDLLRALGIGASGYILLFALEALAFFGAVRIARIEPTPGRAVQLGLTILTALLATDHVGRHWIDSPFTARSVLLFASAIAAAVGVSWLLARVVAPLLRTILPGIAASSLLLLLALWTPRVPASVEGIARADRPNVILISIDTARADYLSCYGYPARTTPALDRIAAAGTRFTQAFSPENWTLPAHASMLTSLYPPTHGVEDLDSRLAEEIPTLAEIYADHGYRTLGMVDGDRRGFVGAARGFDRGFEHYMHYPDGKGVCQAFLPFRAHSDVSLFREVGHSDDIVRSAMRWIDQTQRGDGARRPPPFFLFLHVYDVHASWGARWPLHRLPYQAHREMLVQLGIEEELPSDHFVRDGMSGARYLRAVNRALERGTPLDSLISPEDVATLESLYASSLHFVDAQIGILDRFLQERGLLESTIVLITSDHGEEFREHGRFGHHQDYRETLHIPLLIRWPGQIPALVAQTIVGTTDLAPTLLQLCAIPAPESFQGRSLVPLFDGEQWTRRATFMGNQVDGVAGVRTSRFSYYVRAPEHPTGDREDLYDVRSDSLEQFDLAGRKSAELDSARVLVAEWLHRILQERPAGVGPATPMDAETLELLRSLGYIN